MAINPATGMDDGSPAAAPAAPSARLTALRNLSSQIPVANTQFAQGQQAAQQMQLQKAVQSANPGGNITQTAQDTGASAAGQTGQNMIKAASQSLQTNNNIAQTAVQGQQQQSQADIASLQAGSAEQKMGNVQRLANLSESVKSELYDKQMQFQKDEMGRTKFSSEQLADYAKVAAQNDQQYQNYAQSATQASQRQLQMMDTAFQKVSEDLNQKYQVAKQNADQAQMKQLTIMKRDAQLAMDKAKAAAANKAAMWGAVGTVVGGTAGAFAGGPAGAMAGSAAGGALATGVASQT